MFESAERRREKLLAPDSRAAFPGLASPGNLARPGRFAAGARYAGEPRAGDLLVQPMKVAAFEGRQQRRRSHSSTNTGSTKFGRLLAAAHCAACRSQLE